MAVSALSPTLPGAAEEEPASSGTAGVTFGTHFGGRRGDHSLLTSDQWDNLVWVVSKRKDRISHSFLPTFLARGVPGQTQGFSLRMWNERNSLQKWSHSCFNRYQRESLVPGKDFASGTPDLGAL